MLGPHLQQAVQKGKARDVGRGGLQDGQLPRVGDGKALARAEQWVVDVLGGPGGVRVRIWFRGSNGWGGSG